jgi:hypothetical protein
MPQAIAPLFRSPAPHSVWSKTIFQPTYDPMEVVQSLFRVRTKGAAIVPFVPFRTQEMIAANLSFRNTIVKPRQVGSSTIILALMAAVASNTPNISSLIVTHRDDTTEAMRQTVKNFLLWLQQDFPDFGIEIGTDNADALHLRNTDSWFYFGAGSGVGRSRTIQMLLASELAHWGVGGSTIRPGEFAGMAESVPDTGLIFAESTPNGAAGTFYDLYQNPRNSYVKHFYPWFLEPSRRLPLHGHELKLKDDEQLLVNLHGLDYEQIAWRRKKFADLESEGLSFLQEYPEDDITCFTAGTKGAFPAALLSQLLRRATAMPPHIERVGWQGDAWDPGGELLVWSPPRTGLHYVIACDVGGGHPDGDASYAVVRCHETGDHVASLRGRWSPVKFAELSVVLARQYNEGYLSHEANGIGLEAVNQAALRINYKNYHYEKRGPTIAGTGNRDGVKQEWAPGFYITPNARTPLLVGVKTEIVEGTFRSYDSQIIREMSAAQLVRGKVAGGWADKIEIPESIHDDGLMAYAQAVALSRIVMFGDTRARPMQAV